jgi:uncharacterized protein (TIGR03083 family)
MNAPDVLKYGQLTLLSGLEGLPDADWETPGVCGVWSVKQIVAHLASYEAAIADVLLGFVDSAAPTPTLDRMRADPVCFNDDEVAARTSRSPADTLAELKREHERAMELACRIPPETYREPGTLPWYGLEYSLDDLLVYMAYGHKREHVAQVCVFRDVLASAD